MKKIIFTNKVKQIYYHLRYSDIDKKSVAVLLLLKTPAYIETKTNRFEKFGQPELKNIIADCFIKSEDVKLVENIMRSNRFAIQHLKDDNASIADLSQIKTTYGHEIKKWNNKWPIIN